MLTLWRSGNPFRLPPAMLTLRPSTARGHADHGWLQAFHSFSFAGYLDPDWMGFGALRVLNQDRIQGGQGFPTHGHRDMEIVTFVLEGALEHKDSLGNGSVIRPGDVQFMSAGRGVQHSEFNAHPDRLLHLLQMWVEPARSGGEPRYEERHCYGLVPPLRPELLLVPLSLALGVAVMGSIWYLANATAFWFETATGPLAAITFAHTVLGGVVVPLDFYPDALRLVCDLLPFRASLYTPVALVAGKLEGPALGFGLAHQVVWFALLAALCKAVEARGVRRLVAHGG